MKDFSQCELPDNNPPEKEIVDLLTNCRTIAIVGLSDRADRDSHRVASYLKAKGYEIVPVNPNKEEILGTKCYTAISSIPQHIDIVNIFRTVEAIPGIVEEAIKIGAGAVWMQRGLAHNASAGKARSAGLFVVQSRCLMLEHKKIFV